MHASDGMAQNEKVIANSPFNERRPETSSSSNESEKMVLTSKVHRKKLNMIKQKSAMAPTKQDSLA